MITNFLMSFIGATGIFLVTISLARKHKPSGFERIQRLTSRQAEPEDTPAPGDNPLKTLRVKGLAAFLAQADLHISPIGFLRTGIAIGLATLAVAFVLTGTLVVSIFVCLISTILYLQWLYQRRDTKRLEYEEALAELCDRLGVGAQLYGSLKGALTHAAETAPEIVRGDFNTIASQITSGASIMDAFAEAQRARQSYSLDLLADTLTVWSNRGATIPLHQILNPLSTTIRETASERRRMHAELSGVRTQMRLVAIAPVILVALLRFSSHALASIYASPPGMIIQTTAYLIALMGFLAGTHALSRVARVLEIEGA
jgi:Flp pilus assembly protein TadB